MVNNLAKRLEKYTLTCPQEVLKIDLETNGEADQILIFKGFSSSLIRPTAFDPDVSVFPDDAKIINIDRLKSPYTEAKPIYIQQGLTWEAMEELLTKVNV
jgi:hypothetical protein